MVEKISEKVGIKSGLNVRIKPWEPVPFHATIVAEEAQPKVAAAPKAEIIFSGAQGFVSKSPFLDSILMLPKFAEEIRSQLVLAEGPRRQVLFRIALADINTRIKAKRN